VLPEPGLHPPSAGLLPLGHQEHGQGGPQAVVDRTLRSLHFLHGPEVLCCKKKPRGLHVLNRQPTSFWGRSKKEKSKGGGGEIRKKNVESWSKEKKKRGHLSKNRRPPKPSPVSILFSFHFPLVIPFFHLFFLFLFPCYFNHPFHCSQSFIKRAEKMLSNDKFPGIVVKKPCFSDL
jgi:hypothetical protein